MFKTILLCQIHVFYWLSMQIMSVIILYKLFALSLLKMANSSIYDKLQQLECMRSEIPPAAPWLPILVIHIRSHVIKRQSQRYKFQKCAKTSHFLILQQPIHATHLLKLLDKMGKYEIDLTSIAEDTERTQFCPQTEGQTDRLTDGQMDGRCETIIPPFQLRWSGGYNEYTQFGLCCQVKTLSGLDFPDFLDQDAWNEKSFCFVKPLICRQWANS